MPEIKLDLDDPQQIVTVLEIAEADAIHDVDPLGAEVLGKLRAAIEAQLPKPSVAEPREFGSIVLGRTVSPERVLWQRAYDGTWYSERGAICHSWTHFQPDVEVLRVGVAGGHDPGWQKVRDLLFRSPSGDMTDGDAAMAYKDLRFKLGTVLAGRPPEQVEAEPGADPVEEQILQYSKHLYDRAATMTEEMVEVNLRTLVARVLELGKAS
jgi:hypothetical protein